MLKYSEIEKWSQKELVLKSAELKKELFFFKLQKATSGVDKPHKKKDLKKSVARILTVLAKTNNK